MYAGSDGAIARIAAIAVPGLRQPWFASTLIAISAPTAWRTAATRLASSSGSAASPTLTFTVRNPSATCRSAAAAIAAGSPMLMTRDICNVSRARPPSSCQRGIPAARATRSCSAMSSAALAAGAPSTRASSACSAASRLRASRPISAGARSRRRVSVVPPQVSPVTFGSGVASPQPSAPSRVRMRTRTLSVSG